MVAVWIRAIMQGDQQTIHLLDKRSETVFLLRHLNWPWPSRYCFVFTTYLFFNLLTLFIFHVFAMISPSNLELAPAHVFATCLSALPEELCFYIFSLLDYPDLVACSRVCHEWQRRALDPFLHKYHLIQTARWLNDEYGDRPTPRELYQRQILLSERHLSPEPYEKFMEMSILLSKSRTRDAVRRGLASRPSFDELLSRGVIKRGGNFAEIMTSIERQKVVDIIRGFFSGSSRPTYEMAIKRGIVAKEEDECRKPVRTLTRMFSYWSSSECESRPASRREAPPRAKVYKMRQQFESIIRSSASNSQNCSPGRPLRRQLTGISGISQGAVSMLRQRFSVS